LLRLADAGANEREMLMIPLPVKSGCPEHNRRDPGDWIASAYANPASRVVAAKTDTIASSRCAVATTRCGLPSTGVLFRLWAKGRFTGLWLRYFSDQPVLSGVSAALLIEDDGGSKVSDSIRRRGDVHSVREDLAVSA
jgi:hypothetical protein